MNFALSILCLAIVFQTGNASQKMHSEQIFSRVLDLDDGLTTDPKVVNITENEVRLYAGEKKLHVYDRFSGQLKSKTSFTPPVGDPSVIFPDTLSEKLLLVTPFGVEWYLKTPTIRTSSWDIFDLENDPWKSAASLGPDGKLLATIHKSFDDFDQTPGKLRVWDLALQKKKWEKIFPKHVDFFCVALSPNEKALAIGADGFVSWDSDHKNNYEIINKNDIKKHILDKTGFTKDEFLSIPSDEYWKKKPTETIIFVDPNSGNPLGKYSGKPKRSIYDIKYSLDGKLMVFMSSNIETIIGFNNKKVMSVSYFPSLDEKMPNKLSLLNTLSNTEICQLESQVIDAFVLSNDGKWFAVAYSDDFRDVENRTHFVTIWNLKTLDGKQKNMRLVPSFYLPGLGAMDRIISLNFGPDNQTLYILSESRLTLYKIR